MKNNVKNKIVSMALGLAMVSSVAIGGVVASTKTRTITPEKTLQALASSPIMALADKIDSLTGQGKTYYISPDGKGNGETADSPMAITSVFPSSGITILEAGDTLIVAPGEYKMSSVIRVFTSGTRNKFISVRAADPSQKTVLDFSSVKFDGNNRGVQIDGNFWHWYGVDVCGAGDNGMYIAGSYNIIENSQFYNNRDTGLQLGRGMSDYADIDYWPNYNLIKNCTSFNNYDNETYGENADGFAAKLTVGYGNIFDGCIAYRNSDDGWDLYAKTDSGNIGAVIIYNCVAFENGYLQTTQKEFNDKVTFNQDKAELETDSYMTHDGDGNGFKLGGSTMEGDVLMYNCLAFNNRLHGVTDNSNPGVLALKGITSYDNGAGIDNDKNSPTFGQIVPVSSTLGTAGEGNNIDVSRQEYSYNSINRVFSVNSGAYNTSVGADLVRGSATNSILSDGNAVKKSYTVSGSIDMDTKNGAKGVEGTAVKASEVFAQLPITGNATDGFVYNVSGLYNSDIHKTYRNADGSINMGDLLKIVDNKSNVNGVATGAFLSASSYEDYTHYNTTALAELETDDEAILNAAKDVLFLETDAEACYQNFQVLAKAMGATVTWSSSNESALKVGDLEAPSRSGSQYVNILVNRDPNEDKQVTLTATVSYKGKQVTREFPVTVKQDVPSIGNIYAENVQDGRIIIDQYAKFTLPELIVENASDYNGKVLDRSLYNLDVKYMYATSKTGTQHQVLDFTPSASGVYQIIYTVTMKADPSKTATYSYYVYVASASANVDFAAPATVNVYQGGYIVSGSLNNVTGSISTYASTKDEDLTAQYIIENGESRSFRNDSIKFNYENANDGEYYVYYVICNANGEPTSQVYKQKIEVVDITTTAQFIDIASKDTAPSTIYLLKEDLDFSGVNYNAAAGKKTFKSVLNGMGHTIKNVTISASADGQASLFYKVDGGTIMNVKFENISLTLTNKAKQLGLVATCYGGYFYNIAMNNVSITASGQRTGALIGQLFEGSPLYVDRVSLVNDDQHKLVAEGQDLAAIVGTIQTTSSPKVGIEAHISNVFVKSTIWGYRYAGGIVGRYDDAKVNVDYLLEITNCYVVGTVRAIYDSAGGLIGTQSGLYKVAVKDCVTIVNLYHKDDETVLVNSQKNSSGIFGHFNSASTSTVENCYSNVDEYNTNYSVFTINKDSMLNTAESWTETIGFDLTGWTFDANNTDTYITLDFLA